MGVGAGPGHPQTHCSPAPSPSPRALSAAIPAHSTPTSTNTANLKIPLHTPLATDTHSDRHLTMLLDSSSLRPLSPHRGLGPEGIPSLHPPAWHPPFSQTDRPKDKAGRLAPPQPMKLPGKHRQQDRGTDGDRQGQGGGPGSPSARVSPRGLGQGSQGCCRKEARRSARHGHTAPLGHAGSC